MLFAPLPANLQEQELAERMREVAQRRQCSPALTEAAVGEALRAFAETHSAQKAQAAMLVFLSQATHGNAGGVGRVIDAAALFRPQPTPPEDHAPRLPSAWVERWPAIVGGLIVAITLLALRIEGLL